MSNENNKYSSPILGAYNLLYLNIDGARKTGETVANKLDSVKNVASGIKIDHGNLVHLIAITETNILDSKEYLENYTPHYSRQRKNGGSALFVHTSLGTSKNVESSQTIPEDIDILMVNITDLKLNIVVVYKKPSVSATKFTSTLIEFIQNKGNIIVVGDMNLNLMHNQNQRYVDQLKEIGFTLLNKRDEEYATRVQVKGYKITKTIIDHMFWNCNNFSYKMSVMKNYISDHEMIMLAFDDNNKRISNAMPPSLSDVSANETWIHYLKSRVDASRGLVDYLKNIQSDKKCTNKFGLKTKIFKILTKNAKIKNDIDKLNFNHFIEGIFNEWDELKDGDKPFNKMLAEMAFDEQIQYPINFNFYNLYDKFVQSRINTYCVKNIENLEGRVLEAHIAIARNEVKEVCENGITDIQEVGLLLEEASEERPVAQFIHRSLRDYFSSRYLIDRNNLGTPEVQKLLFDEILLNDENKFVRKFFNDHLGRYAKEIENIEWDEDVLKSMKKRKNMGKMPHSKLVIAEGYHQDSHIVQFLLKFERNNN